MHRTIALVLAGGEGRRLLPLTLERSKPAIHFGGRYRLVDFVLSNLVNSGVRQIKVVAQYRSTSLLKHLSRAWPTSSVSDHEIDAVPAAMNHGPNWFRGTADAIWQNLDLLRERRPEDVLIFSSDHIYKMDVADMVLRHRAWDADLTVAVVPVPRREAHEFGCVDVDASGRVIGFLEKPSSPPCIPGRPNHTLVSMGNYVFRSPVLVNELRRCMAQSGSSYDFGKDILNSIHQRQHVRAYDFTSQLCPGESEHARGYWRDVGTIDAYHQESMDLISVNPRLNLYNESWPIRGAESVRGPAKFVFADREHGHVGTALDSIVGAGTIVSGARLERTVCSEKVRLESHAEVTESVLFPEVKVGRGARLHRCIIDRGVHIPDGLVIGEDLAADRSRFHVSDGGVVVVSRADLGQSDEFDVIPEPRVKRPHAADQRLPIQLKRV